MDRTVAVGIAVVVVAVLAASLYLLIAPESNVEIVRIDGSSTVFPVTSAWAVEFNDPGRQVVVAFSGTGAGFQKFCRGETDLSDASRPIKTSERETCAANGITGITEFLVANDGLSIVVPATNTWVDHLTVKQLCRIWTSNASAGACDGTGPRATKWSDLDPGWPAQAIRLFGPGVDSGTFDYFVEVTLDPFGETITDQFFPSEDDNVLVQGIAAEPYSVGYFGYAYVVENLDKIRPVAVDDEDPTNGDGAIAPNEGAIADGTYAPYSRPLFIYANSQSLGRPTVRDFLRFGYSPRGGELIQATGYVPLTAAAVQAQLDKIPV